MGNNDGEQPGRWLGLRLGDPVTANFIALTANDQHGRQTATDPKAVSLLLHSATGPQVLCHELTTAHDSSLQGHPPESRSRPVPSFKEGSDKWRDNEAAAH